jgi:hypothetical protein
MSLLLFFFCFSTLLFGQPVINGIIVNKFENAGNIEVKFNPTKFQLNLLTGVYLYKLTVNKGGNDNPIHVSDKMMYKNILNVS